MGLAAEATVMLYDGSPFAREAMILFDYAQKERITHLGTSAKFIDALSKRGVRPGEAHDLPGLRMLISTGSPLAPESFDYVYASVKKDVCLASISGGTDLMGAFIDASAVLPVYRGELQCASLGMAVDVFDEEGNSITGEKGELVCTRPFPSMPLGFWNDRGDERYHAAYFAKYENVWCHGDWCEKTKRDTFVVYGRSDATLNPGGVRIGTAEIYRVVERIAEIEEALAIGQIWQSDTRVVLFVKLKDGIALDAALEERIRAEIRKHASPRHVPAKIIAVADIPRTKNGKVVELAVKAVVHDMPVTNTEALANPEALELFRDLPELAT
jgi:acetoacetyl-CoA synthetase